MTLGGRNCERRLQGGKNERNGAIPSGVDYRTCKTVRIDSTEEMEEKGEGEEVILPFHFLCLPLETPL